MLANYSGTELKGRLSCGIRRKLIKILLGMGYTAKM